MRVECAAFNGVHPELSACLSLLHIEIVYLIGRHRGGTEGGVGGKQEGEDLEEEAGGELRSGRSSSIVRRSRGDEGFSKILVCGNSKSVPGLSWRSGIGQDWEFTGCSFYPKHCRQNVTTIVWTRQEQRKLLLLVGTCDDSCENSSFAWNGAVAVSGPL
ncbi:unnamed protein product [Calypogeia fissa]